MESIVLIGMPGVGKSSVGIHLARFLGFDFFDGDDLIEKRFPNRQKFLDQNGSHTYLGLERSTSYDVPLEGAVFSPGGSIIYLQDALYRFRQSGCFIVHLSAQLEVLYGRIPDIAARGIVGLSEPTLNGFADLFRKREPRYRETAAITLDTGDYTPETIAFCVAGLYRNQLPKRLPFLKN